MAPETANSIDSKNDLSGQSSNEGGGKKHCIEARLPKLTTPDWLTALATVAAAAIASVVIAYQTYLVSRDTSDLKNAVANISTLASQTKRQADDSDKLVKGLGGQISEMQKQTTAFQSSATAAQGQLQEMRDEQRPVVDIVTIESTAPLQTDPVIGIFVNFNVVNSGKTAAILAYPHAKLILGFNTDVLKRQREACAAPVKATNGSARVGFNVRAGLSMPIGAGYALTAEETKTWKTKPDLRMVASWICGVRPTNYRPTSSTWTQF